MYNQDHWYEQVDRFDTAASNAVACELVVASLVPIITLQMYVLVL